MSAEAALTVPARTPKRMAARRRLIRTLYRGTYRQGHRQLRTSTNSFCCQGVACMLDSPYVKWALDEDGDLAFRGSTLHWPDAVRARHGFSEHDSNELAGMNDGSHLSYGEDAAECYTMADSCTFDEIAMCMQFLTLAGF